MQNEYFEKVQECAEQGQALARQMAAEGNNEPLYLYCRPSEPGKPGRLMLARDSAPVPPGVQLVTGEGLRSNVPFADYFRWIVERARRAPVLAIEEAAQ